MVTSMLQRVNVFLVRVIIVLGSGTCLLAASVSVAQDKPQYGGHLRVGYTLEPTSLDPHSAKSGGDVYYWRQMFDQLINVDLSGKPDASASLASSWEIAENPHSMTLTLRPGVKFHDGTPFNAEAVKKNIERVMDPATKSAARTNIATISSVDVLGEFKVRLNLADAWAPGPATLSLAGGAMNSPTAMAKLAQDYGWNPSGSGPFKLKEVVTGSYVRLVRNENYWGKDKAGNRLPYLDEVTIRVIKDETVLASALRAGEIDIAYVPNREVDAFLKDPKFSITKMEGGNVASMLVFNPDMPAVSSIHARQAIAHAINPADINKAVYFGKSSIADAGVWPPGTWAYQPSPAHLRYDLKLSREALVALGKPQGFEVDILTFNNPLHQQAIEIIRAQLARVGIKANIEVMTVGGATEKMFGGRKTSIYLTSWPRNPEPDTHSAYGFKAGGFYNASRKSTPALEAMITHGATTYDPAKRTEIYRRVTDMVLMQANWQPLLYGNFFVAAPKKIQNMNTFIAWDGRMQLKELWIRQQ